MAEWYTRRFESVMGPRALLWWFLPHLRSEMWGARSRGWAEKQIPSLRCGMTTEGVRGYLCPRRERRRARRLENSAPAPPTSASTTVGFSGESVQPVCACTGAATNNIAARARNVSAAFFIAILLPTAMRDTSERNSEAVSRYPSKFG